MESYRFYPFVTGLFKLACLQDSPMLQHVSGLPSFLRLNNIPLYVYTTSISRHLVCSHLLVTVNSAAVNKDVQIFLLNPRSGLLNHVVILFLSLEESPYFFS